MTANTPKSTPKAKKPALKHAIPQGLGKAGEALWTRIVADLDEGWRLDEREQALLEEAGRTADDIVALDAAIAEDGRTVTGSRNQVVLHPGIAEVRQLRALQLRLLSSLELTDPKADLASGTPHQLRARRASAARWDKQKRRRVGG